MENVLLISSTDKANELLEKLLWSNGYKNISNAKSSAEARRIIMHSDFEIIVINSPLSDELGSDLAVTLTNTSNAGVLLIVKNENVGDMSAKVEQYGVVVIPKPLNKSFFYQAISLVHATRNRLLRLEKENKKLKLKLEETRLVDRAKCLLIENNKISENDAHRFIEKQAMDTRKTKKEIALLIIEEFDYSN